MAFQAIRGLLLAAASRSASKEGNALSENLRSRWLRSPNIADSGSAWYVKDVGTPRDWAVIVLGGVAFGILEQGYTLSMIGAIWWLRSPSGNRADSFQCVAAAGSSYWMNAGNGVYGVAFGFKWETEYE